LLKYQYILKFNTLYYAVFISSYSNYVPHIKVDYFVHFFFKQSKLV